MQFKAKKVAIVGFGLEGKATFDYIKNQGAKITIFDVLSKGGLEKRYGYKDLSKINADFVFGRDYLKKLKGYDIIIRTPFARPFKREFKEEKKRGAIVTTQIKMFFDLCPCPIIGVTGTKGKGTTSTLIYKMLKKSGKDAYLGGNIGFPAVSFLHKLKKSSIVVLELSSFQLMDLKKSPYTAVVLMTTKEHLDWHESVKEYVEAKKNIVRFQKKNDIAIISDEYKSSREFAKFTKGEKYFFSKKAIKTNGCYVDGNKIMIKIGKRKIEVANIEDIALLGGHNMENVNAAILASYINGAKIEDIRKAIKTFRGLEHRLQIVKKINGVKYINDSFSTTPETAIAAIRSFDEPEILIAGGSYKGSDYNELGKEIIKNNVKAVILIGEMAGEIEKAMKKVKGGKLPKIIKDLKTMKDIVKAANKEASKGDVVLLSPGCASFGMFKDYKDRGKQFEKEVKKLG